MAIYIDHVVEVNITRTGGISAVPVQEDEVYVEPPQVWEITITSQPVGYAIPLLEEARLAIEAKVVELDGRLKHQWQVREPGGVFVDIPKATGKSHRFTFRGEERHQYRCVLTTNTQTEYSDIVVLKTLIEDGTGLPYYVFSLYTKI